MKNKELNSRCFHGHLEFEGANLPQEQEAALLAAGFEKNYFFCAAEIRELHEKNIGGLRRFALGDLLAGEPPAHHYTWWAPYPEGDTAKKLFAASLRAAKTVSSEILSGLTTKGYAEWEFVEEITLTPTPRYKGTAVVPKLKLGEPTPLKKADLHLSFCLDVSPGLISTLVAAGYYTVITINADGSPRGIVMTAQGALPEMKLLREQFLKILPIVGGYQKARILLESIHLLVGPAGGKFPQTVKEILLP